MISYMKCCQYEQFYNQFYLRSTQSNQKKAEHFVTTFSLNSRAKNVKLAVKLTKQKWHIKNLLPFCHKLHAPVLFVLLLFFIFIGFASGGFPNNHFSQVLLMLVLLLMLLLVLFQLVLLMLLVLLLMSLLTLLMFLDFFLRLQKFILMFLIFLFLICCSI